MLATYHNHSRWSDGKATVEELIAAAQQMNIGELGISDHWVFHPDGTQFKWAMPTARLGAYIAELVSLRERNELTGKSQDSPALRIGLEVDWYPPHVAPEHRSRLREALDQHPFDYLIGSVHEVRLPGFGNFMIDGSPAAWDKINQDQRNELYRIYWRNIKTLAEGGVFDIVAHIDLPKKFAFYPTIDLSREIADALDAIAAARTPAGNRLVVELNTAGWHKPCADGYPTLDILKQCRARDIPVTISADAHQPDHLLREFKQAAQRLSDAGYDRVARFAQRQIRFEPLADAV